MAKQINISDLSQKIAVQTLTEVTNSDGSTTKSFTNRFNTVALIQVQNTSQAYAGGMDEKDTLYNIYYRYHSTRFINITDRIVWNGKILKPVGDCVANDFGDKRFFKQMAKHSVIS